MKNIIREIKAKRAARRTEKMRRDLKKTVEKMRRDHERVMKATE